MDINSPFVNTISSFLEDSDYKIDLKEEDLCHVCFRHFNNLNLHYAFCHKKIKEKRCYICGCVFIKEKTLMKHLMKHDSTSEKCFVCESKWPNSEELFHHLENHKEIHIYGCEMCSASFATHLAYYFHKDTHSTDPRKKCCICDINFTTSAGHKTHMAAVHANNYVCPICKKSLSSCRLLRFHMWKHKNEFPFFCHLCDSKFPDQNKLTDHIIKRHTEISNFKCHECNKEFKYLNSYRAHMALHDDKILFKCNECDKNFRYKVSLKEHLTGVKCFICENVFYCRTLLSDHQTDKHPSIFCPYCPNTFTVERSLKRHLTVFHSDKIERHQTFSCNLCSYVCNTKHNLSRHKRRSHL